MENFNIFAQVKLELEDFFTTKIKIAEKRGADGKRTGGFEFSQQETLQIIEFIDNSKFISGEKDKEGQTKFYLNTASFRKEVASKNIAIGVKNFNFVPEEGQPLEPTIIARKKFRKWAKDQGLADKINDTEDRFPKYGTIVGKRCGDDVVIIPLDTLRNQQNAKSLKKSSYVIEEHADMTLSDMEEYEGWDLSELELKWDGTATVQERYGRVPVSFFNKYSKAPKVGGKDTDSVYCIAVVTLEGGKDGGGVLLFLEETECPYEEEHYARQDGRWLGVGEIEKQIENQAARNAIFNLRKKSLAWSAKNLYESADDGSVNNLVTEVKDGAVLKISAAGQGYQRIDTTSRANGDFNSVDTLLENNGNQRGFTFEVATGESLPSSTPFRLGALLSNAVNSYYKKKQELLGNFWKKITFEIMIPQWIDETEEEFIEGVFDTEEGYDELVQAKKDRLLTNAVIDRIAAGKPVDMEKLKSEVEFQMSRKSRHDFTMTREEIKNMKYRFDLDITGESIDVPRQIETLTNFWTSQIQQGDREGANVTMRKILALAGQKMPASAPVAPASAMTGKDAMAGATGAVEGISAGISPSLSTETPTA